MANSFYNENFQGLAGQTARAEHVKDELAGIGSAFDAIEAIVNRSLRVVEEVGADNLIDLPNIAARAGKFLRFNSVGQPEAVQSGFTWKGSWATSTAYQLGDVVKTGDYGSLYICTTAHTSAGSGTIDLTKFEVMIDLTGLNKIANEIKTSSFTAVVGGDYMVDSSAGNVTITLPAAPILQDAPINITHIGGSLASGQLITIARNGKRIMGLEEDMSIDAANTSVSFMWSNETKGWRLRVLA